MKTELARPIVLAALLSSFAALGCDDSDTDPGTSDAGQTDRDASDGGDLDGGGGDTADELDAADVLPPASPEEAFGRAREWRDCDVTHSYDGRLGVFQDGWRYGANGLIVRQWRDLGVDGVIEEETANTYRDEGTLASITHRYDNDSDGAADYVQFVRYTEDGHIELEEVDTDGDGTWDWRRTATYVGGELDTLDIDEDADGVPDARYEVRYDERGRPAHLVGVDENGAEAIVWDYYYDEDGRLSRVDYRESGNGPVASSLEYFYRDDGTVESTRSSRDGRWRFFDRFGRNTESEWDDDRDGYYDRRIIYEVLYSGEGVIGELYQSRNDDGRYDIHYRFVRDQHQRLGSVETDVTQDGVADESEPIETESDCCVDGMCWFR